jgi:hypothetical protein
MIDGKNIVFFIFCLLIIKRKWNIIVILIFIYLFFKIEESVDVRNLPIIKEIENLNKIVNSENMSYFESFVYLERLKNKNREHDSKIKKEQVKIINQMLYILPIALDDSLKSKWDEIKLQLLPSPSK